jgi:hypothetical protein
MMTRTDAECLADTLAARDVNYRPYGLFKAVFAFESYEAARKALWTLDKATARGAFVQEHELHVPA